MQKLPETKFPAPKDPPGTALAGLFGFLLPGTRTSEPCLLSQTVWVDCTSVTTVYKCCVVHHHYRLDIIVKIIPWESPKDRIEHRDNKIPETEQTAGENLKLWKR